jgi:UTP--glucose-1-phosphate uridylyltransferase
MKQMTDVFDYYQLFGDRRARRAAAETRSYGIVKSSYVPSVSNGSKAIVEKPKPEDAPSTLAVVGRYILTPRIFHHLENVTPGSGGEIQLTDGMAALLAEEQVLAYRYIGTRYDCGSKLGYCRQPLISAGAIRKSAPISRTI